MLRLQRFTPFLALCGLLFFAACEDPSGVGIGLIGDRVDAPQSLSVTPGIDQRTIPSITGNATRFLAGRVQDPLLGTSTAIGQVDFGGVASVPAGFRDGPVTEAVLLLVPNYVYGDTLGPITLRLRNLESEWQAVNARSDTRLSLGAPVLEFSFNPLDYIGADSLIRLELPLDWVAAYENVLLSENFVDVFHGFALEHVHGNTVVGFLRAGTQLVVTAGEGPVSYPAGKTLTTIDHNATGSPIHDQQHLILHNGVGRVADIGIELGDVNNAVLNRASIILQVDTLLTQQFTPASFVRPQVNILELLGVNQAGELFPIQQAERGTTGQFTFAGAALREALQQQTLGTSPYVAFRLRVPAGEVSLSSVVLYGTEHPVRPPLVSVTLTPIGQ
jgi:hypothetical protein